MQRYPLINNMANNPKNSVILSLAYFPPIQYMTKFLQYKEVYIEARENYQTQSYRNRAVISGPNGLQNLSIPVKKSSTAKPEIREVEIDYKTDWQKDHWRSIENAYKSSPFFEFYRDAFLPYFEQQNIRFLFEYNLRILTTLLEEIEIQNSPILTEHFYANAEADDYRFCIHPKPKLQKPDEYFQAKAYSQVFSDRFAFLPNLSILDLLFNQGPNTENHLKACLISKI
jgi:hypothetical protein